MTYRPKPACGLTLDFRGLVAAEKCGLGSPIWNPATPHILSSQSTGSLVRLGKLSLDNEVDL